MKTALILVVLSLALIAVSLPMEPFRTPPIFGVLHGNSEAYFAARESALTYKFRLQDYGITLLFLTSTFAGFSWRQFKAPKSRTYFLCIAIAAPIISVCALIFDLLQGQARWEFPPWADSLGIPLMGAPVILILGLFWAFANLILLRGREFRNSVPLSYAAIRRGHPYLLVVCLLTSLLILGVAAEGAYWFMVPGTLWLYFYASIAAVRYSPHDG